MWLEGGWVDCFAVVLVRVLLVCVGLYVVAVIVVVFVVVNCCFVAVGVGVVVGVVVVVDCCTVFLYFFFFLTWSSLCHMPVFVGWYVLVGLCWFVAIGVVGLWLRFMTRVSRFLVFCLAGISCIIC